MSMVHFHLLQHWLKAYLIFRKMLKVAEWLQNGEVTSDKRIQTGKNQARTLMLIGR